MDNPVRTFNYFEAKPLFTSLPEKIGILYAPDQIKRAIGFINGPAIIFMQSASEAFRSHTNIKA